MAKAPCLNCEDRYPCCHDECDKFQEYKEDHEKESKVKYAYKSLMYNLNNFREKVIKKRKKGCWK